MTETLAGLLRQRIAAEPARPFVTVVSDSGRVELSAATLGNWVAKTAGLLADDLFLPADAVVDIDVPLGWQSIAWVHAIWRANYVVGRVADRATLLVRDEEFVPTTSPGDVVLVSRHPLGLPVGPTNAGLAAGCLDWSLAARVMPDQFVGPLPLGSSTALVRDQQHLTQLEVLAYARDLAATWQVGSDTRFLLDVSHAPIDAWLGAAIVPLVTNGSVLIWSAARNPTGTDLGSEAVTTVAR